MDSAKLVIMNDFPVPIFLTLWNSFTVQGEWSDHSIPPKTPLHQTKSNPLSPNLNEGRDTFNTELERKKNQTERRRDNRNSKILKDDHNKLSKKASVQSTSSNGKDHEDGAVIGTPYSPPTSGAVHSLMFASTYTRKNG